MNGQLRSILADTLGLDLDAVTSSLNRDSEVAWDSLNHLRLITAIEEAFDVKLSMEEIQGITNVAELADCVTAHVGKE